MKRSCQKRMTALRKLRQAELVAEARRLRVQGLDQVLGNTEWYGAPDTAWRVIREGVRRVAGRIFVGDLIEARIGHTASWTPPDTTMSAA